MYDTLHRLILFSLLNACVHKHRRQHLGAVTPSSAHTLPVRLRTSTSSSPPTSCQCFHQGTVRLETTSISDERIVSRLIRHRPALLLGAPVQQQGQAIDIRLSVPRRASVLTLWCGADYGAGVVVESVFLRLHGCGVRAVFGSAD